MSYQMVLLLGMALSTLIWTRRVIGWVFGMSRAAGRVPKRDPGPSFEQRIEAQLAELARQQSAQSGIDPVPPPAAPRAAPPSGFGRKRVQPRT